MMADIEYSIHWCDYTEEEKKNYNGNGAYWLVRLTTLEDGTWVESKKVAIFNLDSESEIFQKYLNEVKNRKSAS